MASAVPELAFVAANVVLPQLVLSVGSVSSVPNTNDGNTKPILSVASKGAFNANIYVTDDGASVTALSITSLLTWNADVGAVTSVDAVIDEVAAAIFVAPCNVTATVLVVKSAACAN